MTDHPHLRGNAPLYSDGVLVGASLLVCRDDRVLAFASHRASRGPLALTTALAGGELVELRAPSRGHHDEAVWFDVSSVRWPDPEVQPIFDASVATRHDADGQAWVVGFAETVDRIRRVAIPVDVRRSIYMSMGGNEADVWDATARVPVAPDLMWESGPLLVAHPARPVSGAPARRIVCAIATAEPVYTSEQKATAALHGIALP